MIKRTVSVFLKLFFVVLATALLCEIAFYFMPAQYFYRQFAYRVFGPPNYNPYTFNPGAQGVHATNEFSVEFKVNQQGLRDVEHTYEKPDGVFRILTLGDSFTLGHGVEVQDIYVRQLEGLLNRKKQAGFDRVEVINAGGAGGYSQDGQYLFLKNDGLKYQPDLVLVGLFVHNDISEIETASQWLDIQDGLPQKIRTEHYYLAARKYTPLRTFCYKIIGRSRFLSKLNDIVSSLRYRWFVDQTRKQKLDPSQFKGYDPFGFFRETLNPATQSGFQKWQKVILGLNDVCKKNRIQLLVVLIPLDLQIYYEQGLTTLPAEMQALATAEIKKDLPQKRLRAFLDAQQIKYVDLLPSFKNKSSAYSSHEVYFDYDKHWKPLGHRLAAEFLTAPVERIISKVQHK